MSESAIFINAGPGRAPVAGDGFFYLMPGQPLRFFQTKCVPRELMRVPDDIDREGMYRMRRKARKISWYRKVWDYRLSWQEYVNGGIA